MNTGKQINAMVVVLLLTVISIGAYALFDPFRADMAEEDQLEMSAERGATTFALNCRLCHGDRGEGGASGGRLPAALPLDRPGLQGIENELFSLAFFDENFTLVRDTIMCGRAGTSMPTWGRAQGSILSEEQIRQLTILISGGDLGADPYQEGGFWDLAQEHADEIDALATEHATVQTPGGSFSASATELVVSNAAPFSVGQYIRIGDERLQVVDIPSTGQHLVQDIGRTPDEFMVSGASEIEVGTIIRLDGELLEVISIREDGDPGIEFDVDATASDDVISVSDPAFFSAGYVLHAGDEQIDVIGPIETGQLVADAIGRAETTITASGSQGIEQGMVIRIEEELLRVTGVTGAEPTVLRVERGVGGTSRALHPRRVPIFQGNLLEVERGTGGTSASAHAAGTQVLLTVLEVKREVLGSEPKDHAKNAEIFLGHRLIVERGVLGTQPADHANGTLILDFPPPPENPTIVGTTCGQRPPVVSVQPNGGPTPTALPGAQQVDVSLIEFGVISEFPSIVDGPVEFQVTNDGTIPHNFIVVATDLAPGALPVDAGAVNEEQVDVIGGFSDLIASGETRIASAQMPPGSYVLVCNVPGHYQGGMYAGFEVTAP